MNKRYLRAAQTHFPWLRPAKFGLYNLLTRRFGRSIDPDFRFIADLPAPRLILDIGGNWGQSIHAFQYLTRPARIVSFEPSPYLSARLARVFAADPTVEVQRFALGAAEGGFTLYTPVYRRYVWDGLASTIEGEARGWLNAERVAGFDPAKVSVTSDAIAVRTLDSFGLAPDLVKIDVQGAETAVVQGGLETFRAHRPISLIEDPRADLVALLADVGLTPYRLDGRSLVRGDVSGINALFMSDDKVEMLRGRGYTVR